MRNRKYKELEKERDEYKKLAEQKGKLIDHLKREKKGLISLLNQVIDNIPNALTQFLQEDKHFQHKPYVFISSDGRIIGYTEGFKEKLDLDGELLGKNCYTCLKRRYPELNGMRNLRRFFNTYEKRQFNITIQDGKEKTRLNFVKGKPVILRNLSFGVSRRKKTIETVAFVPVIVKSVGRFIGKFSHDRDLNKQLKQYEKERKEMYLGLITKHGWTQEMIVERENAIGYDGLKKEFLELENELKKRQESYENKKAESIFILSKLEEFGLGREEFNKLWGKSKGDIERFRTLCIKKFKELKASTTKKSI